MNCPKCGFVNVIGAKYCIKCGHPLNNYGGNEYNNPPQYYNNQSKDNKNLLIICITIIIITLIVMGTLLFLSNNNENTISGQSESNEINITRLNVNQVSFYLDGNPNTGIPATINVGKEHTGENMEVLTTYSRDGINLNHPSAYENHVVDEDGNIIITEYAPIPKYPDYCLVEIRYNNQTYRYGCDMGKYKGSQISIPKEIV